MSIQEVHSSTTITTSQTELTYTTTWIGRGVENIFGNIGNAISSVLSNIMQTPSDTLTQEVPANRFDAIKVTKIPTDVLKIIDDYCGRMNELKKSLLNSEQIPDDLKKYAEQVEFLDLTTYPSLSKLETDKLNLKLLELCKNVKSLQFFATSIDISKKIGTLENLKRLEITAVSNDSTLDTITSKGKLQYISLDNCLHIGNLGLSYIARCKDIATIKIVRSSITDDGLEILTELTNLTHLDINNNYKITDKGLLHIGKITTLRHLDISGLWDLETMITDIGIQSISNCKELEYLNIKRCYAITKHALYSISLLPKLKTLDLSEDFGGSCTDDTQITEHLVNYKTVTWLNLSLCRKINKSDISNISKMEELKHLDLDLCDGISEKYLHLLHPLKNLKTLSIYGTCITDQDIENIKREIPGLTVVEESPFRGASGLSKFISKDGKRKV